MIVEDRGTKVVWNGKEVHNPAAKKLIAGFAMLVILAGLLIMMLAMGLFIFVIPIVVVVALPLHVVLRKLGRNGFFKNDGESKSIHISPDGFRKTT